MRAPPWLQEIREVLAIHDTAARLQAMQAWEARWLTHLKSSRLVTEVEQVTGGIDVLEQIAMQVRQELGQGIGDLMADVTIQEHPHAWGGPGYLIEVRGDVLAIRREPAHDD